MGPTKPCPPSASTLTPPPLDPLVEQPPVEEPPVDAPLVAESPPELAVPPPDVGEPLVPPRLTFVPQPIVAPATNIHPSVLMSSSSTRGNVACPAF
jgi:hypothetical protein